MIVEEALNTQNSSKQSVVNMVTHQTNIFQPTPGIDELRAKLTNELQDLLKVIEANYLELERKQREVHAEEVAREKRLQMRRDKHRNRKEGQYNIILSALGSITLPFVIITGTLIKLIYAKSTGIFSIDLPSRPTPDFWNVTAVTAGITVFLFVLLIILRLDIRRFFQKKNVHLDSVVVEPQGKVKVV
jgi:hypothetical protein